MEEQYEAVRMVKLWSNTKREAKWQEWVMLILMLMFGAMTGLPYLTRKNTVTMVRVLVLYYSIMSNAIRF